MVKEREAQRAKSCWESCKKPKRTDCFKRIIHSSECLRQGKVNYFFPLCHCGAYLVCLDFLSVALIHGGPIILSCYIHASRTSHRTYLQNFLPNIHFVFCRHRTVSPGSGCLHIPSAFPLDEVQVSIESALEPLCEKTDLQSSDISRRIYLKACFIPAERAWGKGILVNTDSSKAFPQANLEGCPRASTSTVPIAQILLVVILTSKLSAERVENSI